MTRIICVSNRVPDSATNFTGGLAVAVHAGMAYGPEDGVWIGATDRPSETRFDKTRFNVAGVDIVELHIDREEYQGYYNGMNNQSIYPLFHELMGEYHYEEKWLRNYLDVNERFAEAVLEEIKSEDDLIWVHDTHLLPLAYLLRTQDVGNKIGYFNHIPYPSARVLRAFPAQHDLRDWLDSYDLVGFQTEEDAEGYPAGAAYPIGIDWEAMPISQETRDPTELRIIGMDRLDYSKGILQRFDGFDRFMRKLNFDANVRYCQVSPPTKMECPQYADYSGKVMKRAQELSERYPGKFEFRGHAVSHPMALKTLGDADIGLVTPLRDGMNLVALEFIACQNPADPGVLVLSKTAGCAEYLQGAILVDPYDADSIAEGIYIAATMLSDERRALYKANMDTIKEYGLFNWWMRFVADLSLCPV